MRRIVADRRAAVRAVDLLAVEQECRLLVRPDQPEALERLPHHRVEAEPVGLVHRREAAEDAGVVRPLVVERQEHHLHRHDLAALVGGAEAEHGGRAVLDDGRQQAGDRFAILAGPEVQHVAALELAAIGGAETRAGQAERIGVAVECLENEGIAEQTANGRGVDLVAFGRRSLATQLRPIFIK